MEAYMLIADKFNEIAKEYDEKRKLFIPCYDDFYGITTSFIAQNITSPKNILDIGSGTGLLASFWIRHFPKSNYILLDAAGNMLDVARKRFSNMPNITYCVADYTKELPSKKFDAVISALSIHHLSDDKKKQLFDSIYKVLTPGGVFVNYDQFCGQSEFINGCYTKTWESSIINSTLSKDDIKKWRERQTLDKECCVESELRFLRDANFTAECVYSFQKFSVIFSKK